eukprot:1104982-Rhodomonas_salina.2
MYWKSYAWELVAAAAVPRREDESLTKEASNVRPPNESELGGALFPSGSCVCLLGPQRRVRVT